MWAKALAGYRAFLKSDDLNEANADWLEIESTKGAEKQAETVDVLTRWMSRAEEYKLRDRRANGSEEAHERNVRTDMEAIVSNGRSGRTQVARDVIDRVRKDNRIPMKGDG